MERLLPSLTTSFPLTLEYHFEGQGTQLLSWQHGSLRSSWSLWVHELLKPPTTNFSLNPPLEQINTYNLASDGTWPQRWGRWNVLIYPQWAIKNLSRGLERGNNSTYPFNVKDRRLPSSTPSLLHCPPPPRQPLAPILGYQAIGS